MPLESFHTPRKHKKTRGFPMYSGERGGYRKRTVAWNGLTLNKIMYILCICCLVNSQIITFHVTGAILYPLKASEKQRKFYVFSTERKIPVAWNQLSERFLVFLRADNSDLIRLILLNYFKWYLERTTTFLKLVSYPWSGL